MKENKEQSLFRRIFKWTFRTIGIIIFLAHDKKTNSHA